MAIVTCPNCGAQNRVDERRAAEMQPKCGRCGTPLPSVAAPVAPLVVSDETFEQVVREAGEKPILIDCWADWCPPCKMLAPTIDQLAAESNGRWIVGKLDTDANPRTASRFGIEALPTMLIFKRGQEVDRLVGLQPENAILARLQNHL